MSNTKHTAGPWVISPASTNTATWDEIYSADMKILICSMEMLKERMKYVDETMEQLEGTDEVDAAVANAKLIAAAPELLEALQAFIEHAKYHNIAVGSGMQEKILSAIKKATK